MSLRIRQLSRAIGVMLWFGTGVAGAQVAGTPLGPTERVHELAGGVTGAPAVASTPFGHQLVAYLAETPEGLSLLARISPSTFGVAWDDPVVISRHDWLGWPAVAMSKYGYFVAAWERNRADGGTDGVFARFYDLHGQPRGDEFRVNELTGLDHDTVVAATDVHGSRYLIAWKHKDASGLSVRAQLFDSQMQRVGPEQRIDTNGTEAAVPIAVAMPKRFSTSPGYVSWTGSDPVNPIFPGTIYLRTVATDGTLGAPVVVARQYSSNGNTVINYGASINTSWDSSVVVAWKTEFWGSSGTRSSWISSRRYTADLQPLGYENVVSETASTSYGVSAPVVSMDFEGEQWVGWESRPSNTAPASLKARLIPLFGSTPPAFFVEESVAGGNNVAARIATDTDGATIFAWTRLNADGSIEALQRRYRGHFGFQPGTEAMPVAGPIEHGGLAEFNLRVTSSGSEYAEGYAAATGVRFDVELPEQAELVEAGGNGWNCTGSAPLHCRYDDVLLAGSETLYLPIRVRAPSQSQVMVVRGIATANEAVASSEVSSSVQVADLSPEVPVFPSVGDAARGSEQVSSAATIAGIEAPVSIYVSNGQYSLNGGAFTHVAGQVAPGDSVRVRHTAAATFSTDVVTTLTVGGVDATFRSTTLAADTTPDPFAFAAVSGVARNAVQTSNEILVAGINTSTPLSVAGGTFSIDGGAFSDLARSVEAGQRVRVQHASAGGFSASTTTVLTIGGVSASFVSTTEAMDTLPAAFAFVDQTGVATGVAIASAPITVAGINAPATVSVAGGSYSVNGGAFTAAAGTVQAGDQVRVQHLTSASALSAVNTTLTVGGVSDVFTSTTGSSDTTPNAFAFADVTGARRNRSVDSNTIVLSGFNATVPLSIAGGGASYQKNGGSWTSAPGTVRSGDTLRLRMTASSSSNTTVSATVTVGGVSDTWSVTSGTK